MTLGHCVGGTHSLVAQSPIVAGWQQLSGFKGIEYFDGHELFVHDVRAAQEKTEKLTVLFEQHVSPSQQSQPVLSTLLNRILHWFGSEKKSEPAERSFPITAKSSCVTGLAVGICGSLLTQQPLPLLLGLSACFPSAPAQEKIGSEFQVNNYTANDQLYPSVASFSNGNFVVTWESDGQDGSGYGIFGQLFDSNGTKIGNEFRVNTVTNVAQEYPSVASFPNGDFIVVWQSYDQDFSDWGVYGQIFNGTGTKISSEFPIFKAAEKNKNPSVASLKDSNFVVAYQGICCFAQGWEIHTHIFNETGNSIGNHIVNTYVISDQEYPSVASLENGNFIIVWQSPQDSSGLGIFGQLFNASGSKIRSEFRINSYARDDQIRPAVASFKNGNFVVTWISKWQDGDLTGIYVQLFNAQGRKVGVEFQVNTENALEQSFSKVASLSNDHFIVVWQSLSQDGSIWGVYGQLFDENGAKIGNEFQVNTYTADDQSQPSVDGLQDGNFVVTWHSNFQDGAGYGIYGQIFHDNFTITSSASTTSTSQTPTTILPSTTTTSIAFTSNRSSTIYRTTETSTIRSTTSTMNPITTDRIPVASDSTSRIPSPSSNRNNGLFWLGFLLGASGWAACLALTGYLFFKSRRQEEGSDSIELREKGSLDRVAGLSGREPEEEHYQRTPDHVHPL